MPILMASPYLLTDNELLTLGEQAIENSLSDGTIAEAVAPFGYGKDALRRGRSLLDRFRDRVDEKRREYGEQVSATRALEEAWDAFHTKVYMPDVAVGRVVFKGEDGPRRRLRLVGGRADGFDEYVQDARVFYETLQNDEALQARMTERGVPPSEVAADKEKLDELARLDRVQEREKSEAQQATRRRDDARRAFADWLSDYQKFAKVALRETPDLAEQLGMPAPS